MIWFVNGSSLFPPLARSLSPFLSHTEWSTSLSPSLLLPPSFAPLFATSNQFSSHKGLLPSLSIFLLVGRTLSPSVHSSSQLQLSDGEDLVSRWFSLNQRAWLAYLFFPLFRVEASVIGFHWSYLLQIFIFFLYFWIPFIVVNLAIGQLILYSLSYPLLITLTLN